MSTPNAPKGPGGPSGSGGPIGPSAQGGASAPGMPGIPGTPETPPNSTPPQPEPARPPAPASPQPSQPQQPTPPQPPTPSQAHPVTAYQDVPSAHAGPPPPPPARRVALTVPLGKMLYLCVTVFGVINLFLGYVDNGDFVAINLYKAGVAVFALAPTMLFLAGLVALRSWLPGERTPGALPAMITSAIFVTLVLSALGSDGAGDLQTLFLVFGGVQFVIAWLAYLFDSGVIAASQ